MYTRSETLIGKTIGKYKILSIIGKAKNGETLFSTECLKCGYIDTTNGMPASRLRASSLKETSKCLHIHVPDEYYIGKVIGKYKIIEVIKDRSRPNRKLYITQCLKCGYIEKKGMTLSTINKAINTKKCEHVYWKSQRLRHIFKGIKRRCYQKGRRDNKWYYDKGIKICNEWLKEPWKFQDWAFSHGYEDDLSIDRIDPDKDYSPENCRWIIMSDNNRFKSNAHIIEIDGIKNTILGWGLCIGYTHSTLYEKMRNYIINHPGSTIKDGEDYVKKFICSKLKKRPLIEAVIFKNRYR